MAVRTETLYKVTYQVTKGLTFYVKDGITKNQVVAKIEAREELAEPELSFEEMKEMLVAAYGNPKMYDEFGQKLHNILFTTVLVAEGEDATVTKEVIKDVISKEDLGLAIYAFVGAKKYQDKIQQYKEQNASVKDEFYGTVGTRYSLELTFDKVIHFEDYSMYFYHDNENRCFKWSTTNASTTEVGKTYKMVGTVKDHREYNGVKQTCINRCKVLAA